MDGYVVQRLLPTAPIAADDEVVAPGILRDDPSLGAAADKHY
jgi:hypothetical protein